MFVFTFAGGVATLEGRDQVPKQAEQHRAVACAAAAEVRGQAIREGGRDEDLGLVLLLDAHNTTRLVQCGVKDE